jgi:hypothetical protein
MSGWLIGGAVVFVLGLLVRRSEGRENRERAEWLARATKTTGTIARYRSREATGRGGSFDSHRIERIPVVLFRAANGADYEFEPDDRAFKVGQQVAVAYEPEQPSNARVITAPSKIGCWMILMVIAIGLVIRALLEL